MIQHRGDKWYVVVEYEKDKDGNFDKSKGVVLAEYNTFEDAMANSTRLSREYFIKKRSGQIDNG
jgi:hypothetical protein